MSEKCMVYNLTKGPVSFGLAVAIDPEDLEGMPSHRRRRAIKSNIVQIVVPYGQSVDLCEKTGLPADRIKASAELVKLQARSAVRVEVVESKDAPAPPEMPKPQTRELEEPEEKVEEEPEKKVEEKPKKVVKRAVRRAKKKG